MVARNADASFITEVTQTERVHYLQSSRISDYRAIAALREVMGEKLLEAMGIKIMVPKKGLPTALLWNFPVFVVKTLLYNGIGLAQ